jgi:LemA protein
MMISSALIFVIVVVVLIVGVIGWAVSAHNRFRVLTVKIDEADAGIDVALTKRYDTLTKLMDVVRAFAKHEKEVYSETIRLRAGMGMAERAEASTQMDTLTSRLFAVAENYPELRSSDNFMQLQDAIVDAEDHLQASRRVYNMNVSSFNAAIVQFPASIIANNMRLTAKDFFEAEERKRQDVKIDL